MLVAALAIVLAALDLDALFPTEEMFESRRAWKAAGFLVVPRDDETRIMVATHPLAPSCIFKKYPNQVSSEKQLEKYQVRVDGANAVADFIAAHRLRGVVIPEKQIVDLGGARGQLLVAQHLDVMDQAHSEAAYRHIDKQTLEDLVTVLYTFRGLDSGVRNLLLTTSGQVALIDTERWDDREKRPYLKYLRHYLTRGQFSDVNTIIQGLHKQADAIAATFAPDEDL